MALNVWGGLNAWPGATSYTLVADTGNYAYTGTSVTLTKSGAAGSTLNLTITGIPDGSYMTVLDDSDGIRVQRQNEVYSSQQVSIALSVNVGTTIKGYVDDSLNPSSSGAYIEGVTE
tara:strand:- start:614 stop:964 length:351 start_codon:yes stop_codon:yes gene_type:complete